MFALSLYMINKTKLGKTVSQKVMYGVALGLMVYSSIYVYLLFYNEPLLTLVNQFILYILIADLSASLFYYFKLQQPNIIKKVDDVDEESVTPSVSSDDSDTESVDGPEAEGDLPVETVDSPPEDILFENLSEDPEVIKEI